MSKNKNEKYSEMEKEIGAGRILKNEHPNYLNFVELTRGQLQLTNFDKILILIDFCKSHRIDFLDNENIEFEFKINTLVHENNHLSTKNIKQILREVILKDSRFKNMNILDCILDEILDKPTDSYLNYLKMTPESLYINLELLRTNRFRRN